MCSNFELTYKIQMADIEEELKREIIEYINWLETELEYWEHNLY